MQKEHEKAIQDLRVSKLIWCMLHFLH
jgi:hypothetical protein